MKNLNCNDIVVVFIMEIAALASMISFGTLIQIQTAAAQQFSMSHRILADNSEGNNYGMESKW